MGQTLVMVPRLEGIKGKNHRKLWPFRPKRALVVGGLPVYLSVEDARKDYPDDELWEIEVIDIGEEENECNGQERTIDADALEASVHP